MLKNLSIERTTLIVGFVLLFAIAVRVPADTDTWWHIRSGEHTLTQGMIYTDPFSHTYQGETWINHSWGAQVVMYGVWQLGGNAGLAIMTALLAVGGIALLYPISAGNTYIRVFMLILGATTAAVFWSARPQMFSFFFSAAILYILYRAKRNPDAPPRFWMLLPVMWLWGNSHAGYSIGYLFLLAFIVGEACNNLLDITENALGWKKWRQLVLFSVLSIFVLLLTPYNIETLLVPFNTVSIGSLRDYIQEWNSPNFQGRETWGFIAMLMLLFGTLWASRLKYDWSSLFLLLGTLFLALLYGRNIAVFAVAATPILTYHTDSALNSAGLVLRPRRRTSPLIARLNLLLVVVVVAGVLLYCVGVLLPSTIEDVQAERLPVAATEYLNTHDLPREMFNSYNWGGYLMFAAPQYPVFIDGRTDLYGEFLRTYLDTTLARNDWREVLATHNVQLVVVETGSGLDRALRDEADWTLVYSDDLAVIHVQEQTNATE